MKKVLIITYYWPPAGGPGVQRILKFAKYLPEFGWQPIVLTVKNGEYPAIDASLLDEVPKNISVYKTTSLEPGSLYKKFVGLKPSEQIPNAILAEKNINWKQKLAAQVRLNFFVPDAKRGWIYFAVKEGLKIIKQEKPNLIFSSSPPPTTHLIAKKLAQKSGLKWVADFRDPWTDMHYYENLTRIKFIKQYDKYLEQKVLDSADKVICISKWVIDHDFGNKIPKEKCITITNGFDDDDFKNLPEITNIFKGFILMHLGMIGKERIPYNLIKAIQKLDSAGVITPKGFRFICIGKIEQEMKNLISESNINNYFQHVQYRPHKEAIAYSMQASAMLLSVNNSKNSKHILTGKIFEYMRTGAPILAIGPEDGEAARIIKEGKFGATFNHDDFENTYKYLKRLIENHNNKSIRKNTAIEKYSRKFITKELSDIFNQLEKQT